MNLIIFQYLNNLAGKSAWFDSFIIFSAHYLPYWLVAGVFLLLFFYEDKRRAVKNILFIFGSSLFVRFVLAEIIRFFYYHPRPFEVMDGVYRLIFHEATASFPSGHAVFFFALATAVYLSQLPQGPSLREKGRSFLTLFFFLGAILMGMARVIAGVHWPYDILGGAILGIFSVWAINSFLAKKV